jgi:uncharacterized protein YabE (DUF348 family)
MQTHHWLVLVLMLFIVACQSTTPPNVTVIDGDQIATLQTEERVLSAIFSLAGVQLTQRDRIFVNGVTVSPEMPVTNYPHVIQLRRAISVTINTPQGEQTIHTSALTVGEVLQEAGIQPRAKDKIDPPANTSISDPPITIYYSPASKLTIVVDGHTTPIASSARTVGEALAEAGIPLLGLDYSIPSENEALPLDGQIKVVRVSESVLLVQKSIPFETETIASSDVPLDQTQILSPGENGLSVERIRIRYEDGVEVSRNTEEETLARAPKNRTLAYGTKVEIKTTVINGATIEYWRAVQMYATSYSPCRLGTSACGSTTASGKQLEKGVVALRTDLYFSLKGQPLYIPGYGYATVEDACGGCTGQPWIDLGFSDNDYEAWHSVVTVYFLTPVPQTIPYDLQ